MCKPLIPLDQQIPTSILGPFYNLHPSWPLFVPANSRWCSPVFSGKQTEPYRNQVFLGAVKLGSRGTQNQEFAEAISSRFLGGPRTARCAVPLDIPNVWQISVHERPSLRRPATFMGSTTTRGLPNRFPCDFAKANPDRTRSLINSLSNSAIEANIPKTSLPFGVDVSTPS